MEIYIIRHGTTPWNEKKKLQGSVDKELNEAGRMLARKTAEGLREIHFDKIYSSPLKRALETAQIIGEGREIPLITDERLKEIDFGDYEGQNGMELQKDESQFFRFFFSEPEKYRASGDGEELEELCERTKQFMEEVIEPQKEQLERIMIVGHGAMNKSIMCHVLQHGIEQFWSGGLQSNCGVIVVRLDQEGYHLIEENKLFY